MPVSIVVNEPESRVTIMERRSGALAFPTVNDALEYTRDKLPDYDEIVFGTGSYHFRSGVRFDRSVRIKLRTGAVLLPSEQAIGLFSFEADDCTVEGPGIILCERFIADQSVIKSTGDRTIVRDLCFDVTAPASAGERPMRLLHFFGGSTRSVTGNTFLPNRGVVCISAERGKALTVSSNRFTNSMTTETTTEGHVQRPCHRCIELVHEGWAQIQGNRAESLGWPETDPVDAFLDYRYDKRLHVMNSESGHIQVTGNYIEDLAAATYVRLRGCAWFQITGNTLANTLTETAAEGEGAIIIEAAEGGVEGRPSNDGLIGSNQLHNLARPNSGGVFVLVRSCVRLSVLANQFATCMSENALSVYPDDAPYLSIIGNTFEGYQSPAWNISPRSAIHLYPGSNARMVIGSNAVSLFYAKSGDSPLIANASTVSGKLFDRGLMNRKTGKKPDGSTKVKDLTTNVWYD